MSTDIQQIIDSGNSVINLPAGEFKGPFYINHPCTVTGNNTTLWNNGETVVVINSEGVTLKDLRIEMINSSVGAFSVLSGFKTLTENVEIIGKVSGFGEEDNIPDMQKQIKLGKFRSDEPNSFCFDIYAPSASKILSELNDITIIPEDLKPGINTITVNIQPLPVNTLLYGDIILKSEFNRRFYISGLASESAEISEDKKINILSENNTEYNNSNILTITEERIKSAFSAANDIKTKTEEKAPEKEIIQDIHVLTRGERISLEEYSSDTLKISMGYRSLHRELDIDPYAFMLDSSGVTSCDDDFVFFGNRDTRCDALTFNEDKTIDVELKNVPKHIQRVSFVYSIYQPGVNDNFSKVVDPFITISHKGKIIVSYTAKELFAETTIIFMDMYRYKNIWKLNTIGQGYREGLKRLCANYGLIVS